jgi:hypothetical protein
MTEAVSTIDRMQSISKFTGPLCEAGTGTAALKYIAQAAAAAAAAACFQLLVLLLFSTCHICCSLHLLLLLLLFGPAELVPCDSVRPTAAGCLQLLLAPIWPFLRAWGVWCGPVGWLRAAIARAPPRHYLGPLLIEPGLARLSPPPRSPTRRQHTPFIGGALSKLLWSTAREREGWVGAHRLGWQE